ncbi:MAG: hypothetical protein KAJ75_07520, partial [Alphaproteobacteria bacterium]|nr:hypothetical protein [Alphaproteobacteria bacterium]
QDESWVSIDSPMGEHTTTPIVQEKNHQSKRLVQSVNNGDYEDNTDSADKQILEPLNDKKKGLDEEIVETLFNNSDYIATYMTEKDRKEQNLLELTRTIVMIKKRNFPDLRVDAWTDAINQHGVAAFGAVIVAVEKHDVENKTAYLAKMLLKPDLRQTIMFSLRKLPVFRSHRLAAFGAMALEN